jgi:hypothetical protein
MPCISVLGIDIITLQPKTKSLRTLWHGSAYSFVRYVQTHIAFNIIFLSILNFWYLFSLVVCRADIKAPNQQVHLHAQLRPIPCTWAYNELWTSPVCTGVFLCVPGSTWTTSHFSKDRYLDAGGSVTATLPSSTLVGNTWTSRLLTVEPRLCMHMCVCVCVWSGSLTIHCMLSLSLCVSVHLCYHIIVRNSLCTSVTPITASSSGGIVMPMEALNAFLQNVMVTWSAYLLHIWEVLCPETSCHGRYFTFPQSFHAVTMGSKLGHDYFLPHL